MSQNPPFTSADDELYADTGIQNPIGEHINNQVNTLFATPPPTINGLRPVPPNPRDTLSSDEAKDIYDNFTLELDPKIKKIYQSLFEMIDQAISLHKYQGINYTISLEEELTSYIEHMNFDDITLDLFENIRTRVELFALRSELEKNNDFEKLNRFIDSVRTDEDAIDYEDTPNSTTT